VSSPKKGVFLTEEAHSGGSVWGFINVIQAGRKVSEKGKPVIKTGYATSGPGGENPRV